MKRSDLMKSPHVMHRFWVAYDRVRYWPPHLLGWHGGLWCRGMECGRQWIIARHPEFRRD